MPKDTSVLNIQWRYLSLDEQDSDKCRTTVEMFALCRNRPATYGALLEYYYEIKQAPRRLTPDSDQKGPIRHYVQEWNRIAGESKLGCHPVGEDGCTFEELQPGTGHSKPHRVCQRHVGPGRTVEHWVNRRLACRLFPFLRNPDLWVEPPVVPAVRKVRKLNAAKADASAARGTPQNVPTSNIPTSPTSDHHGPVRAPALPEHPSAGLPAQESLVWVCDDSPATLQFHRPWYTPLADVTLESSSWEQEWGEGVLAAPASPFYFGALRSRKG